MNELEHYLRSKKVARIIVITGGGIRGIIPATYLKHLETITNMRIKHMTNMMAGTSVGAITATAVNDYTATEICDIFKEDGVNCFQKKCWLSNLWGLTGSKYKATSLNNVYEKYFDTLHLSELHNDTLIPFYDLTNRETRFFKSHRAKISINENYLVTTAINCSSRAPTYFKPIYIEYRVPVKDFNYRQSHTNIPDDPIHIQCIDGGLTVNDATMAAFVEACEIYPNAEAYLIISIDTGKCLKTDIPTNLIKWASTIPTICMDGSMNIVQHQIKELGNISRKKIFSLNITTNIPEQYADMDGVDNIDVLYDIASNNVDELNKLTRLGELFKKYPLTETSVLKHNIRNLINGDENTFVRLG